LQKSRSALKKGEMCMTIEEALLQGVKAVGRRDAGLFLSHSTGYSTNGIILNSLKKIELDAYQTYLSYLERRQTGEPLQYIIGTWDFMGLSLITDKRALIPRPETELLVEEVFNFVKQRHEFPIRILDVCTGSGCIALALACLLGDSVEVTAADISPEALSLAEENAKKLGVPPERVSFLQSDLLEEIQGEFDIIISNPPYILDGDIQDLCPTVRDYEPHLALNGGADGLDFYRRLIPQSKNALRKGGALFLEIGPQAVMDLMAEEGCENINLQHDCAELARIVSGEGS
jgi:release factor glutamine methyltransferase